MLESNIEINLIIKKIRSGKVGRDEVLVHLYHDKELRSTIAKVASRYGGQKEENDLIFNSTLMQFVKTVLNNRDFSIQSSLHSYLSGITKFILLNERKKKNKLRTEEIDNHHNLGTDQTPESLIIDQSNANQLNGLLQKLGKNCKEVLMYWANSYSMKEIAVMMNYKSDMMAKKKKYKCFKELLDYLEKNPQIKNVLRS